MNEETGRRRKKTDDQDRLHLALDTFTVEVALLFFRMRTAATQYLGRGEHSSGHRSILKALGSGGPQTVPEMARLRSVSRQHIQKLVDGLKADGLVEARSNPVHRRSSLIALTDGGLDLLEQTEKKEEALWRFLGHGLDPEQIDAAIRLVRVLRDRFESGEWEELAAR